MGVYWFYFSDTNSDAGELSSYLDKREYSLVSTNQLESLHKQLVENQNSVLFLKANSLYNIYDLCQEISVRYPHVYIILIVPDNMENIKKAMNMGASDLLRVSYTNEEMRESVHQAIKYMEQREGKDRVYGQLPKEESKVLTISSPKGGVGKTSLTANLAISLAKQGKSVAVIDANIQFGDMAVYFNEKPKRTIYEWVKEAYGRSNYTIDQYMIHHESGVAILAAPSRPEFFEGIGEEHIKTAIEEVKKLFDVVLIDMPNYLSEVHMSCLELADEILLVMTNDLSVIRLSKLYLETLETINLKDKVKVVVNKQLKKQGLNHKKLEEIIGLSLYCVLPEQGKVALQAISTGLPYVLSNPRNQLSKKVLKLAETIMAKEEPEQQNEKKRVKRKFLVSQ
ncbi:AAA family ATPase [Bacillus sp. B15-48]|uniref:AAA family ATPase n=1 Tax=Bacillus sp. B15-48 TaxID=1548601 RepID=UPI00193F1487|nr:AAA family ATPase [Bacillus sp. B15-48]MBM4764490.1 AAA family ATPase [Bacillus sp. B15-48]